MSIYPVGYQREDTIIAGAGGAAIGYTRNQKLTIGDIRATGVKVNVRRNYAARYNFAAANYNALLTSDKKKKMRGGHFLLHRYIIILLWLISIICGGVSAVLKPLVAIPIVISLLYIVLTIYNIVIFKKNRSVLHSKLMIHNNALAGNNEWYTVPIHTRIQDRAALAAVGGDDSIDIAAIREEYTNMQEVKVMVYQEQYIRLYTYFPTKSIIIHIVAFVIAFVFGITLAIIVS
ncbi:unnamed protein product [Adineta steineri]|uniref:Uncharacterized protein n=1 Tax=Adineta steineri TaxID=433720 RepID=A0A815LVU1_9BILA|nr:unnamed protein product [Adineta steineri]CAF3676766.1 unnamed protein product [Adineta steineri]